MPVETSKTLSALEKPRPGYPKRSFLLEKDEEDISNHLFSRRNWARDFKSSNFASEIGVEIPNPPALLQKLGPKFRSQDFCFNSSRQNLKTGFSVPKVLPWIPKPRMTLRKHSCLAPDALRPLLFRLSITHTSHKTKNDNGFVDILAVAALQAAGIYRRGPQPDGLG